MMTALPAEDAAAAATEAAAAPPEHSAEALSGGIERLVARRFAVARSALTAERRCDGAVALARHVAMYLQRVLLERSHEEIARRFRRHPTTVIYACRRVEELRDEPGFDRRIAALEAAIAARALEWCR